MTTEQKTERAEAKKPAREAPPMPIPAPRASERIEDDDLEPYNLPFTD